MTIRSSGTLPQSVINQELGRSASTQLSLTDRLCDVILGNSTRPRHLSDFYGAKAFRYSSNPAVFTWQAGDAVYFDVECTGGWDNGGQTHRVTLVNGTSFGFSANTSNSNGKNNYWGFTFNGSSITSSYAYYAGGSTNYSSASIAFVRVQFLGSGYTSASQNLGLYPSTYQGSSYYLGTTL